MKNPFETSLKESAYIHEKYEIPVSHLEAYFMKQGISWYDYRSTPRHVINRLMFLWEMDNQAGRKKREHLESLNK